MVVEAETLGQLNSARDIVLRDHTLYAQVVPGIVQVVGPQASLGLRRWGADFLAETFASQAVTADEKQHMSPVVLDTLRGYLNRKETMGEDEDISVVKSAIQCVASVYPYVFRHTATTPTDSDTWAKMANIKSSILRRMDTASPGVRMCCIKFVASVVLTQTPGFIADPRRQEMNEISLALVSRDHPTIPSAILEAEASGLLDRLLGVLQDNISDALIVTATLNSLASLVQRRASVSTKIITTVLAFNPFQLAGGPMSSAEKLAVKSMTRTIMSFLLNYLKRNVNNALAGRIQQQVERLKHGLVEIFSASQQLKRAAPEEPTDGLDDAKRRRLDAEVADGSTAQQQQQSAGFRPLPPGPVSLAQLFTLTNHAQTAQFHVERLQPQIVPELVRAIVQSLSQSRIDEAINAVRSRWLELGKQPAFESRSMLGDEDDDDYDPITAFGGTEQLLNSMDQGSLTGGAADFAIGPFDLPTPPPLSEAEQKEYSNTALARVFGTLADLDREARARGKQPAETHKGFNRLAAATAATGQDREGWITLLTRLATRASFDLDSVPHAVKQENGDHAPAKKGSTNSLARNIREALFNYVMENFRSRIDVAIMWLNEEWYSDCLQKKQWHAAGQQDPQEDHLANYWRYTLRLLDAMAPYLDIKDGRILIRLLSEVPALNRDVLKRLKDIALDPERVPTSTNTLLYLIMFRPPVRELALDCLEEMYRENADAKTSTKRILTKWRPAALAHEAGDEMKVEA